MSISYQYMEIPIQQTDLFEFTQPKFAIGQRVRTRDGWAGCIVGLDFYPEHQSWTYGVYLTNREGCFLEEIWYDADDLKTLS